jgi:predicted XRE-type DNA-binding protein
VAWPKSNSDTPLAKAMRWRDLSQTALAERIGCNQSMISRAVRGHCSAALAARILDVIDRRRRWIEESHLLLCRKLPGRYGKWEAPS